VNGEIILLYKRLQTEYVQSLSLGYSFLLSFSTIFYITNFLLNYFLYYVINETSVSFVSLREKTKCQYACLIQRAERIVGEEKKKEKHIFNMMWKVACASKPCVIMKLTKS
jgi:hypothetical protein